MRAQVKYYIADSVIYGNLVCKPSKLSEVDKKTFYSEIDKAIKLNKMEQYSQLAKKVSNLT